MTAENNGVPEDDDPFAYLYRSDGADGAEGGAAPTQPMPGVPRTSYQQATQVGRVQYGQQQPAYGQQQPAYGQQQGYGQHDAYGQQNAYGQTQQAGYGGVPHQAEPPMGGGRAASRGGSSGGGSSRGVMIGAVAVVAAVAIGIGMALFNGNDKTNNAGGTGSTSSSSATASSSASASASTSPSETLPPPADAASAQLAGGATPASDHPGAQAAGGKFVPLTAAGQSITWQLNLTAGGSYVLWVHYANAGADARVNVVVNGTVTSYPVRASNWTHESDWGKAWFSSYVKINLNSGVNSVALAFLPGQPGVNIDQIGLNHSTTQRPWSA